MAALDRDDLSSCYCFDGMHALAFDVTWAAFDGLRGNPRPDGGWIWVIFGSHAPSQLGGQADSAAAGVGTRRAAARSPALRARALRSGLHAKHGVVVHAVVGLDVDVGQ